MREGRRRRSSLARRQARSDRLPRRTTRRQTRSNRPPRRVSPVSTGSCTGASRGRSVSRLGALGHDPAPGPVQSGPAGPRPGRPAPEPAESESNNLELSVVMQGALHMREGILSLFPRCSACLEAVVEGMCWTKCHRHVLIVMLDAASWILLYASSQILETVSSSKIISNYCMHLRS
jgi:hypothetical protein